MWFTRFQHRYRISLRTKTNISQHTPDTYEQDIKAFHTYIRRAYELQPGDT